MMYFFWLKELDQSAKAHHCLWLDYSATSLNGIKEVTLCPGRQGKYQENTRLDQEIFSVFCSWHWGHFLQISSSVSCDKAIFAALSKETLQKLPNKNSWRKFGSFLSILYQIKFKYDLHLFSSLCMRTYSWKRWQE